jgi:hypothetical protein
MSSTGGSGSGLSGSAGATGSSTGASATSGGSGGGCTYDAGAAHREGAPVELTGCAAQVPTAIFASSCVATTCHNSKDHAYALDLQSAGVAARLVNQPSLEATEPDGCTPLKLIDPDDWSQSYILLKVEDCGCVENGKTIPFPPAGTQMPQQGTKLNAAQITCLQQWVEAEAAGPY